MSSRNLKKLILFSFCVFLHSILFSQINISNLKKLDQTDGLSNAFNMHFNTDQVGFFWTSSRDGLNRYDGKEVKIYRPKQDGNSIDLNITSSVFQDNKNRRWFTSTSALHCLKLDSDSILTINLSDTLNSYHYAFHLERDSFLWVIANKNVYALNIHNLKQDPKPISSFDAYLSYVVENDFGEVEQIIRPITSGSRVGLEILTVKNNSFKKLDSLFIKSDNLLLSPFVFLFPESTTSYWVPSNQGLIHISPTKKNKFEIFKHKDVLDLKFSDIAAWKHQYLILATKGSGLLVFDKLEKKFIHQDTLFLINHEQKKLKKFDRINIDNEENLWLSILDDGIYYTNLKNLKFNPLFPLYESRPKNTVVRKAIIENNDHKIFCQGENIEQILNSSPDYKNINQPIIDIDLDFNGELLVLKNSEIAYRDFSSSTHKFLLENLSNPLQFIPISKEEILLLTLTKIYRINKSNNKSFKDAILIPSVDTHLPSQLFFEKKNRLVFLSQDDNQFRIFEGSNSLKEKSPLNNIGVVNGIFPSLNDDFIWLASSTGLYQLDAKIYSIKKILDPLKRLDQAFNAVVEDSLGNVWLSSFWGLYRYLPQERKVQHFTESDGLVSMQYIENSSLYASNGKIYFGGHKGVTEINPKNVKLNQTAPKIQLIDFKVNNKTVDQRSLIDRYSPLRLKHNQNNLLLKFSVLEFSDPTLNRLKYFLTKERQDTILTNHTNPIQFNLLAPGNYQLAIHAANSDEVWTGTPSHYFFTILPPWYQTWWARLLGFFVLIAGIYAYYRFRINQIKKQAEFKRKEAEFKQKEAEYKQLAAETETAVLRLQMNPHFIFNSMNSISNYILEKDIDSANSFLTRFSHLMRTILDRSEQNFTDISDEVELLTHYLDIEAIRLGKQMDYRFVVDPKLDPDETLLPTMILQPFVENAIWHGISPKDGTGLINIRFLLYQDLLLCEVEDNGVGRAYHQKRTTTIEHESKALSITERRLSLLPQVKNKKAHFEIIDIFDESGNANGTKVQLFLPLW